jgi:hypothetical protein
MMVPLQRPTFHAKIGQFLMHLRLMRGWISERRYPGSATRRLVQPGSLRFLEEGKTKHPDRKLLEGVAALYDVPFAMLVQRFIEANYGSGVKVAGAEGERQVHQVQPCCSDL